jgi:hypothetical protein
MANLFEEYAKDFEWYYQGESKKEIERRSSFHAAISLVLADYALSSDEVIDGIVSDASGDKGIDFLYASDDEPSIVYVIQVKHHKTFQKTGQVAALNKMKEQIGRLQANKVFAGITAAEKAQREVLADVLDPQFHYLLLLTAEARPAVSANDLSGEWNAGDIKWSILGREELSDQRLKELNPQKPRVDLEFNLQYVSVIQSGGEKIIHGYINAAEYARRTKIFSSDLFRLNPRLFLSSRDGFHKGMYSTLLGEDDPSSPSRFHLFNNGITAVADSVTESENGSVLNVSCEDFQVVNGCQTTETLWHWVSHKHPTDDVLVPLRIVETSQEAISVKISEFTNSQSAITSADLIANSPLQKKVKSILEGLPGAAHPVFYEARRGAWAKVPKAIQASFTIKDWAGKSGVRKTTLRELAMSLLAIRLSPNQAKEQVASWFGTDVKHQQLFGGIDSGNQMALIVDLMIYLSKVENWAPDANRKDPEFVLHAKLGRYYLAHLIYSHWRTSGLLNNWSRTDILSEAESRAIRKDLVNRIGNLPVIATMALIKVQANANDGLRGKLRKSIYKDQIQNKFKDLIDLAGLPSLLGP